MAKHKKLPGEWEKFDDLWWSRTVRQFSGGIHGLDVLITEVRPETKEREGYADWKIRIRYPDGPIEFDVTCCSVTGIFKQADRLARSLSIGYELGQKGAKSSFYPDTNEDGTPKEGAGHPPVPQGTVPPK